MNGDGNDYNRLENQLNIFRILEKFEGRLKLKRQNQRSVTMIDTISKICAPFVLIAIIDLVFLILIYKAYKRGNYERYNFYVRAGCVISILFIGVIVIAL